MKSIAIIVLAFILGSTLAFPQEDLDIKEFEQKFHQLLTSSEEQKAATILTKNEAEIEEQNELFKEGKANFEEALMEWDDLSSEELMKEKTGLLDGDLIKMKYFSGLIDIPGEMTINTPEDQTYLDELYRMGFLVYQETLPQKYDARDEGLVTSIKNQLACGSCSAFAATAMHETCLIRAGAPTFFLDLSEQQLVDCAYDKWLAFGCEGAWIHAYPLYLAQKTGGKVNHENNYGYLSNQPNLVCQNVSYWEAGATVSKAVIDHDCNETKLKILVNKYKAVVTSMHAADSSFFNYRSGIFDGCSSTKPTHAVTIIGWGRENGIDYWIGKNSWGDSWGQQGFFKIKAGTCGIGTRCAVTECVNSGKEQEDPPEVQDLFVPDACDVSKKYGSDVNGRYTLTYKNPTGGTDLKPLVNCAHSKCTPEAHQNKKNSCLVICGAETCGSS